MVSLRNIRLDPETRGVLLGMFSSITSSIITLYIAQHYIIQRAASAAVEKYAKQSSGIQKSSISVTEWEPLSNECIQNVHDIIEYYG